MKKNDKKEREEPFRTSLIIRTISEKIVPLILMFGIYVIFHGHTSPGGGFQGGVIIGSAFILFAIAFNADVGRRGAPEAVLKITESAGVLLYVGIGIVGIVVGYSFLTNRLAGFPPVGGVGTLLSSGTLVGINIGIGTHVASTIITMFYSFLEEEREEKMEGKR